MIKLFCDICGNELLKYNTPNGGLNNMRLSNKISASNMLEVEIITAVNGVWNGGDVCKYCIIDAVKKIDDRVTENKNNFPRQRF